MRQLYFQGNLMECVEQVYKAPDQDPYLFNYIDSLCYGREGEYLETGRQLAETVSPSLRCYIEQLEILFFVVQSTKEDLAQILEQLPKDLDPFIQSAIAFKQTGVRPHLPNYRGLSKASQDAIFMQIENGKKTPLPSPKPGHDRGQTIARLGESRLLPFLLNEYISREQREADLAPLLARLPSPKRRKRGSGPIKIAHVTTQILDGRHAPSILIGNFLQHHNRSKVSPYLFITEAYAQRFGEYPLLHKFAQTSDITGGHRIQQANCPVFRAEGSLEHTIQSFTDKMRELQIDVAVFHEADPLNVAIAKSCDVPLKVYYQQARGLEQSCFDLWVRVIDLTDEQKAFCKATNTHYVISPLPLDPHPKHTVPRPEVAQDAQLLTTVSNHLHTRITPEFARVVARILKQNPNAWYVPMGGCPDEGAVYQLFENLGVKDRVRLLGSCPHPSAMAEHMTLYLNEFPCGSGLGIVDAMAAGCPIVSMYDPKGPEIGKGGAVFFGSEYCVSSEDAYVEIVTRLLKEQPFFEKWRQHSMDRYRELTNCSGSVEKFEQNLSIALEESRSI